MAHYNNYRNHSLLQNIGSKVKDAAQFAASAKQIWDVGRTVYAGVRTVLPYFEAAALLV